MEAQVEAIFPHVTLVLRQSSWPPPPPVGGWSLRVALRVDSALLPSNKDVGGVWSSMEGRDLVVEEGRSQGGRSREGLLKAFSTQYRESTNGRVYFLTNQQPGRCD